MAKQISKKRERKIQHIRAQWESGKHKKTWLREKALHHMKMPPEDVQAAMGGTIY